MGFRFTVQHSNIVAYLTTTGSDRPPRLTRYDVDQFLGSLYDDYRKRPPLMSSNPEWIFEIQESARESVEKLNRALENREDEWRQLLPEDIVADVLHGLHLMLSRYHLYILPVGQTHDRDALDAFGERAAISTGGNALVLLPDEYPYSSETVALLDPFPSIRKVLMNPDRWPAALFWIRTGASAFIPLSDAEPLTAELVGVLKSVGFPRAYEHLERLLRTYDERRSPRRRKTLLQLSDLHFGTKYAAENEGYLSAHIDTLIDKVDRVVITGDLFENPKEVDSRLFRNFRAQLERTTGGEIIVIPGNHDQNLLGNNVFGFGRSRRELSELKWSSVVIDDDLECVFFCFDSSKDANLARGKITRQQRMDVATEFETKASGRPNLRDYLSVALIHHHPYSFETRNETIIQRAFAYVGITDEMFLRMDEAEEFLAWCVGRGIPLILHGHKHVPRHVTQTIRTRGKNSTSRDITAIGCGTSLGAKGRPLSYNLLQWSPDSKSWSVSFYSDPDGRGFEEDYVALHRVEEA